MNPESDVSNTVSGWVPSLSSILQFFSLGRLKPGDHIYHQHSCSIQPFLTDLFLPKQFSPPICYPPLSEFRQFVGHCHYTSVAHVKNTIGKNFLFFKNRFRFVRNVYLSPVHPKALTRHVFSKYLKDKFPLLKNAVIQSFPAISVPLLNLFSKPFGFASR
jgi:hypothetical protein